MTTESKLEQYRSERDNPTSPRRAALVDAAEELFLRKGIAETSMMDIANQADVSRVTVYRYFPERDHIAYEVAGRMLGRLAAAARSATTDEMTPLEAIRAGMMEQIRQFEELIDAHRFLAMFDNLGPVRESTAELDRWYRTRSLQAFAQDSDELMKVRFDEVTTERLVAVTHMTIGVLARFAMSSGTPNHLTGPKLHTQLDHLAAMIAGYFDEAITPNAQLAPQPRRKRA